MSEVAAREREDWLPPPSVTLELRKVAAESRGFATHGEDQHCRKTLILVAWSPRNLR